MVKPGYGASSRPLKLSSTRQRNPFRDASRRTSERRPFSTLSRRPGALSCRSGPTTLKRGRIGLPGGKPGKNRRCRKRRRSKDFSGAATAVAKWARLPAEQILTFSHNTFVDHSAHIATSTKPGRSSYGITRCPQWNAERPARAARRLVWLV